jgi:hypothetical protein
MGMQLMAMRPPTEIMRHGSERAMKKLRTPFLVGGGASNSGATAVVIADQKNMEMKGYCKKIPVVSDGDGAAAQTDGDVKAVEIDAKEAGYDRGSLASG